MTSTPAELPPDPPVLWHYTSFEALSQIVRKKELWATDARYLNDAEELRHGLRLLEELLVSGFSSPPEVRAAAEALMRKFGDEMRVFVTSFSAAGDSLEQWRAYCPGTRGIAIGFDPSFLRQYPPGVPADGSALPPGYTASLRPCDYGTMDEKRSMLLNLFPYMDGRGAERVFGPWQTEPQHLVAVFSRDVPPVLEVRIAPEIPRLKDPHFAREEEWRLILTPPPAYARGSDAFVDFRLRGPQRVPFIPVPLSEAWRPVLGIVEVRVSPTAEASQQQVREELERFLQRHGVYAPVTFSQIPLRT